ncbi:HAMP domain-containing sensor histidine kinase [Paenibacillus hodogayensis]|uniref:histidine kinase n=1 Tax=Paenibacillus hodogayensis TaxID=279208 RepID=A0ABV5VTW6_9BACL
MSIRKKLLLSNFGMVFIPAVLVILCGMLLYGLFEQNFRDKGGDYGYGTTKPDGASIHEVTGRMETLFAGIRFMLQYEPAKLADPVFLREMDERLDGLKAGLVVMKDGVPTFVSSYVSDVDTNELPMIHGKRKFGKGESGLSLRTGERSYAVERMEGSYPDGSRTSVYLLTDMSPFSALLPKVLPLAAGTLLLILVLTNGVLTFVVSRSFIKPLYALKQAAERIKDGNLDHELKLPGRKDEFAELGGAFEEMRIRLKQSIGLQLQYEENRKELLSNISHDLKTPITAIKGCVEGVLDGIADSAEKRDKYMRMIYRKATDMDRQIDELFLFSKLDLKRVPFHFEKLELVGYLSEHVEELKLQPGGGDRVVTLETEGLERVYVQGDREKLHRVIQNIVDNSMKYADKSPRRLAFALAVSGGEAVVRVSDNGSGIEADALPHIFERFYRADPSRTDSGGGSGLGLAIVKQIVEEHGGRIWAESVVGEGTTVGFALPLTQSERKVDGI